MHRGQKNHNRNRLRLFPKPGSLCHRELGNPDISFGLEEVGRCPYVRAQSFGLELVRQAFLFEQEHLHQAVYEPRRKGDVEILGCAFQLRIDDQGLARGRPFLPAQVPASLKVLQTTEKFPAHVAELLRGVSWPTSVAVAHETKCSVTFAPCHADQSLVFEGDLLAGDSISCGEALDVAYALTAARGDLGVGHT